MKRKTASPTKSESKARVLNLHYNEKMRLSRREICKLLAGPVSQAEDAFQTDLTETLVVVPPVSSTPPPAQAPMPAMSIDLGKIQPWQIPPPDSPHPRLC